MADPHSPTGVEPSPVSVVASDEQTDVTIDVDRWARLAEAVLRAESRTGEMTLTFVGSDEMSDLNRDHMGVDAPTDVLAFPLDADPGADVLVGPVLLGDVVVCPVVAAGGAARHAGTVDDELALLTVHGILHLVGHDHAAPGEAAAMRARELEHLVALHWGGPPPAGFRQEHVDA